MLLNGCTTSNKEYTDRVTYVAILPTSQMLQDCELPEMPSGKFTPSDAAKELKRHRMIIAHECNYNMELLREWKEYVKQKYPNSIEYSTPATKE